MITKDEIEAKAKEFGLHAANIERDYVFGWLLAGLYGASPLRDVLVLKGGTVSARRTSRIHAFPTTWTSPARILSIKLVLRKISTMFAILFKNRPA